jgi:hypothetical protein
MLFGAGLVDAEGLRKIDLERDEEEVDEVLVSVETVDIL